MLDYNQLSKEFDEILATHSKDFLEEWLALDQQKLEEELTQGKEVLYPYNNYTIVEASFVNNKALDDSFFDNSYSTAA